MNYSLKTGLKDIITNSVLGTFSVMLFVGMLAVESYLLVVIFGIFIMLFAYRVYRAVVILKSLYDVDIQQVIEEEKDISNV